MGNFSESKYWKLEIDGFLYFRLKICTVKDISKPCDGKILLGCGLLEIWVEKTDKMIEKLESSID